MDMRTPYFYVIRFKPTGAKYAGCKYGKGCHPSSFFLEGGYFTSSPVVKRMIVAHGLEAFEVVELKTESECGMNVRMYETRFLQAHNCAASPEWLNGHNNEGGMNWGTKEYSQAMMKSHGVSNPSQSAEIRAKKVATWQEKYGAAHPAKTDAIKSKKRATVQRKYGVENIFQVPEVRAKYEETCMRKYGVKSTASTKEMQAKRRATMLARYGVESYTQTAEFQAKRKAALEMKKGLAQ